MENGENDPWSGPPTLEIAPAPAEMAGEPTDVIVAFTALSTTNGDWHVRRVVPVEKGTIFPDPVCIVVVNGEDGGVKFPVYIAVPLLILTLEIYPGNFVF